MVDSPQPTPCPPNLPPLRVLERLRQQPRKLRIILLVLLAIFCIGDTAKFLRSMQKKKPTLKRWLPFAEELGTDDQLYQRHPDYLYPPFFLVLIRPLTHAPAPAAAIIWQLAKYACIFLIFAAAWDLAARAGPFPPWAKVASVIICARYILSDLSHGNVNLFLAVCVTGGAWLVWNRRPLSAGLLIALAACVKVTPGLWAAWLLYKRQWRALLGVILGVIILLEVVPLAVLSPSMNHALLGQWYEHVVNSFLKDADVESMGMNQSVVAITNRLLGRAELTGGEPTITLARLQPQTLRLLQRGIAIIILAIFFWACRGPYPHASPLAFAAEWGLVAPVTLALSGYTWTGHFCLMVVAVCALLAHMARWPSVSKSVMRLALAGFALVLLTTDIITPAGREWASIIGLPLLSALLMGAALIALREHERRRDGFPLMMPPVSP